MVESPDAYERLVLDCMLGDATLFAREDEVERAWGLVDRIEAGWAAQPPAPFPNYAAGTWGPEEADALIERDGRRWRRP
jgi:glucose-6-phosphate 1-dehydrogenase